MNVLAHIRDCQMACISEAPDVCVCISVLLHMLSILGSTAVSQLTCRALPSVVADVRFMVHDSHSEAFPQISHLTLIFSNTVDVTTGLCEAIPE